MAFRAQLEKQKHEFEQEKHKELEEQARAQTKLLCAVQQEHADEVGARYWRQRGEGGKGEKGRWPE